jgi:hypothetical protein
LRKGLSGADSGGAFDGFASGLRPVIEGGNERNHGLLIEGVEAGKRVAGFGEGDEGTVSSFTSVELVNGFPDGGGWLVCRVMVFF